MNNIALGIMCRRIILPVVQLMDVAASTYSELRIDRILARIILKSNKPGSLPYVWNRIRKRPLAMTGLIFVTALFVLSFISPGPSTADMAMASRIPGKA